MRRMTRRSLAAVTWSVLAASFSCSFGDDDEDEDRKPDAKGKGRQQRAGRTTIAAAPSAHDGNARARRPARA